MGDWRKSARRWSVLAFAVMAMALIAAMAVPAYAVDTTTTWYVATTGNNAAAGNQPWAPFLTIGKALTAAGVGDTIKVGGGTYAEHLTISTADLTLEPWDDAALVTIDGSGTGVVATIQASGVVFKNFTVTNSQGGVKVCAGAGAPTLTGNTFTLNDPQVIDEDGLLNIAGILTGNTFDRAVVVHSIPQTIWGTIQAAIAAAAADDTINVAAGTYTEVGQILITKNLTIVGADKSTTIIKPNADTGASSDAKGWWVVSPGVAFNLSDVTLDGTGKKVFHGIRHKGTGTIGNVHFTGIQYNPSGPDYAGFAIYAFGQCGAVDVSDCEFDNIGREGIAYWGAGTTGTYDGNTYTGKGLGNWLDYAVEVTSGAVVTITDSTITSNLGTATSDGSNSAAIIVLQDSSTATIIGNTITGNDIAIKVGYNSPVSSATAYAHGNRIYNNVSGTLHGTAGGAFDATDNWWGSVNGPTHAGNKFNVGSQGDKVGDNVDYVRWLDAPAGSPFAPVTKNSDPTYYASIQAAIDAASAGAVITCAAGTFTENVTVDESVILQGAGSAATTVTAASETDSVFTVAANDVTISGFTATHTTKTGNEDYAGIKVGSGVTGCNIHDNTLTNNQYGILVLDPENTTTPGNNTFASNTASNNGVSGIEMQHSYGNTFTNNTANSNGSYGFRLDGVSHNTFTGNTASSNTVSGFSLVKGSSTGGCLYNTFTNNVANSNAQYGLREDNGDHNSLTGNTFDANVLAGLRLKEVITNLTVDHNNITNSPIGIDIAAPVTSVTTWTVTQNCIVGNTTYGVSNSGTGTLDASHNWWGSVSGPGVEGPGSGDKVSANVTFVPWLNGCGGDDVTLPTLTVTLPEFVVQGVPEFQAFTVVTDNPDTTWDPVGYSVKVDHTDALAVGDVELEYYNGATWDAVTLAVVGGNLEGTFGLQGFSMGAGTFTYDLRAKAGASAPTGTYTVTVSLKLTSGAYETIKTGVDTMVVNPAPTITEGALPAFEVGGAYKTFNIQLANPADGANYAHVVLNLRIQGPVGSDLTASMFRLQSEGSWNDLTLTEVGNDLVANFGGPGGFAMAPNYDQTKTFRMKAQLTAPTGTYSLVATLVYLDGDPDWTLSTRTDTFSVGGGTTAMSMDLNSGWNMISVPLVGADNVPETVFADVIAANQPLVIYEWVSTGPSSGSYAIPTEIDAGRGYWLYLFAPVTINASGPLPSGTYNVGLAEAGWHQVSTPKWPVAWSAVQFTDGADIYTFDEAVANGWVYPVAYSYNPSTKLYVSADLADGAMDPWTGYWICTRVQNLTMSIPMEVPYIPGPMSVHSMSVP
ncbi:MAG: right-handed parallel beta-helix repeat-containing protein, partial [Candidatus Bipolaricaulota bacterium]|nr:right-handed parallel beta-helix repeat-containing protein [Candidatus Bipolaricaulota bacterium]